MTMAERLAPEPVTPVDAEEARRARMRRIEGVAKWVLPVLVMALGIWFWDRIVVWNDIPHYILPGPGLVLQTLIKDWAILFDALLVTLQITLMALAVAVIGGVGLAILFTKVALGRDELLPLRRDPAGHARRLDRAADLHLCRQPHGGAAALRLDRGVLSDPGQHHAGPEIDRPQPARPDDDLSRLALAAAALPATALGPALFPGRPADRGRASA